MNKKDKQKWVKALRSGKYKQGKYKLHNKSDDTFCCLGVAVNLKLCGKTTKPEEFISRNFLNDKSQQILSAMNDSGKSFKTIADYIEENL